MRNFDFKRYTPRPKKLLRASLKAVKIIHRITTNVMDCEILKHVRWQNLGYLYKRKLAFEMLKVHVTHRGCLPATKSWSLDEKGSLSQCQEQNWIWEETVFCSEVPFFGAS